jgi:sulfonate transport system permease protein
VYLGFFIAFFIAFPLGIIAGITPKHSIYYNRILEFVSCIPPMALIPLLILWFGIGEESKTILIVLTSFPPIFLNVKNGIANCDYKLLEVGYSFRFNFLKCFFKIILPNALSDIIVGMRIGMGYSFRAIVGAEMIAAASGLGYFILDAQMMSRSDKVILGIILIGISGYLSDKVFSVILSHLFKSFERKKLGGVSNQ